MTRPISVGATVRDAYAFLGANFSGMASRADNEHTSKSFQGVKANTGTVTHVQDGNKEVLTLSDDFIVPDAPAPHWQIVDALGNTYLLEALKIKGDKINRQITLPAYIHDIAKVQIWCAWAETLLGETSFVSTIDLHGNMLSEPAKTVILRIAGKKLARDTRSV